MWGRYPRWLRRQRATCDWSWYTAEHILEVQLSFRKAHVSVVLLVSIKWLLKSYIHLRRLPYWWSRRDLKRHETRRDLHEPSEHLADSHAMEGTTNKPRQSRYLLTHLNCTPSNLLPPCLQPQRPPIFSDQAYTLRATCPFSCKRHPLIHNLRGGVMWEPPMRTSHKLPNSVSK
jgi:hypothetical protein